MNYKDFDDQELLSFIADSSEDSHEILLKKYKPLIVSTATKMISNCSNLGLEIKDLIQEGYLGLNQAIDTYADDKEALFFTYAKTCIESKMISLIIASKRLKHRILNESYSLESTEDVVYEPVSEDSTLNPEDYLIEIENMEELVSNIKEKLTPLETQVFELKINHFNYKEIANLLDKDPKAIDNAIQRIKIKVTQCMSERMK